MGKIIVKNIKGMSLKARIGLIAIFTLVFSGLIYQGLNQQRSAHAAIGMSAWATIYNSTTFPTNASVAYTVPAGTNRLLVVAVASTRSTVGAQTYTISYGGQALTAVTAASDQALATTRQHTALYYLNEAGIQAATNSNFTVTISGGTSRANFVYARTLTGVDQTTPIGTGAARNYNSVTNTSATPTFATALTENAGDQPIVIMNSTRSGSTTARSITAATNWSIPASGQPGNLTLASTDGIRAGALSRTIPTANTSDTTAGSVSSATLMSMSGISVKAAPTTTLGNGIAGANANVAPGAVDQKINGFSFQASAGTSSVTALTVTTTNQAAIASMRIMNEAGSTQYFTTVSNPGSNTWNFSGGTAIPVTTTLANYKIWVTYKTRAGGAPAGLTATTAGVTAFTSANMPAGSDTADTTLTLSNVHAASTWGSCTAGEAQNVLNWNYGTPGQSALIIRYTANTDTTKPVDGTTYSFGNSFGTGGTVVYSGNLSTYTNVGLTNNTTYYYKIFEYDTYRNYYNLTDVWSPPLTPVPADPTPPVITPGFAATSPVNTVDIPITFFEASDLNPGVAGYMITTTTAQPAAGAAGWSVTPPETFTVAGQGSYTLYPWAKDGSGNVSPLFAAPVTVVVDLTKPTVSSFTIPAQVNTRNIPVSTYTAADTGGTSVAAYMITTSSTAPAFDNPNWLPSQPVTFSVLSDGSHTLYPWVKDAAGNVSLVFGSPRTVLVDTTAPTGLAAVAPADEAVDLPPATTLSCTTATDSGVGGVLYQFNVTGDDSYTATSGWQVGTTYAPPALVKGNQYIWTVKTRDSLGNESAPTAPRTFSVIAPCVRNNPTLILLTPGGSVSSTIAADGGSSVYNFRLVNNDTGDCGSTTFSLSTNDTDLGDYFNDSLFDNGLTTKSVTLATNAEIITPVTITSIPGEDSGVSKTTVRSTDPNHTPSPNPYFESAWVQTTLNVVTCSPRAPLMIVGPDSGYVNKGGDMVYTISVKNTDTGAGCGPVTYTLSIPSESNSTDFNPSQLSRTTLVLGAGELSSAALTVSAKSAAARNALNLTDINISAPLHDSPANVTVRTTVNNPMLHNSDNVNSSRWGGWGVPGKRYGEISCETCHVGGGGDTANIKRIEEKIFTPYTTGTGVRFPGHNKTVSYRRYDGTVSTQPVLGWDSGATPRASSTRVCEICHTYDATGANGVKAHPYATGATLGNHFNTDGTDCTRCHKHNKGFGTASMACNACHGLASVETITASNRYVVAPPTAVSGSTGTLSGTGQVSNDPKVGAHQTHLQLFNGFTNYSTVDHRCQNCHGTLPADLAHASDNSLPAFQGMATRGGMTSASFNSANLTCSNTYCHNPAASTVLRAGNTGSKVFPSWTSARLLGDTRKTQANCGVCHKSPGDSGFEPAASHVGMTVETTNCNSCHDHEGDGQGAAGKRHMDGILFGGTCSSCHGYEVGTWAAAAERVPLFNQGKGTHEKHIAYLVAKWGFPLNPSADQFGSGAAWTNVCGVCHSGAVHDMGEAIGGTGRTIAFPAARQFGPSLPLYNGNPATGSGTNPKSCSNLDCHYKETPVWSTY